MNERQKEKIKRLGLDEKDFKPKEAEATIEDLVEALDILTTIVLGGDE